MGEENADIWAEGELTCGPRPDAYKGSSWSWAYTETQNTTPWFFDGEACTQERRPSCSPVDMSGGLTAN